MKELEKDIFIKVVTIFLVILFVVFVISYALLKNFLLDLSLSKTLNSSELISSFNTVWFEITVLFVLSIILAIYLLKRVLSKLSDDLNELKSYIENISHKKSYDATLEIKHYLEFLHISISLKNIIKRLHKKDKK